MKVSALIIGMHKVHTSPCGCKCGLHDILHVTLSSGELQYEIHLASV